VTREDLTSVGDLLQLAVEKGAESITVTEAAPTIEIGMRHLSFRVGVVYKLK
jgi:hypothetical protein